MAMRKILVEQLRPGMKFTKSLFDGSLNIVLPAGKILDQYALKNLKTRNVEYVETAGDLLEETEPQKTAQTAEPEKKKILVDKGTARHLEIYKEIISTLSYLYNRYKMGHTFETDKLQQTATKLVNAIMVEKNPNTFINLVNVTGKGDYLFHHILNTTILAVLLGKKLGYSMVKLVNVALAGMTFELGMIKIPAFIIEKETKLSSEERNQINTHPILSYQIITRDLNLPVEIARVGLEHHERWDGTGYPRHIKGNEISEVSRIISIIDTYEALTKNRVYREKRDSYDAMKHILSEGSKKFDPELLKNFLSMMSIYPVGSFVRLNNNAIAKVTAADPVSPFRPTVKIIYDEFGDKLEDGEQIKLSREKELYVVKALKSSVVNS